MRDNMYDGLVSEVSEFISNRVDSSFIRDGYGSELIAKAFTYIEKYKKRKDLTDCESYDDLVGAFMAVISYYERRSYKIGFADGMNLVSIKDIDDL